jgi:hypothetical protein
MRTGGKTEIELDGVSTTVWNMLSTISDELRERAASLADNLVHPFPLENLTPDDSLESQLVDGVVYEIAFDGNDSDAEFLEKKTGLTLLGESDDNFSEEKPCLVSGKLTAKRQFISRMY